MGKGLYVYKKMYECKYWSGEASGNKSFTFYSTAEYDEAARDAVNLAWDKFDLDADEIISVEEISPEDAKSEPVNAPFKGQYIRCL